MSRSSASTTSNVVARAIALRTRKGVRYSAANSSTSETTPTTCPVGATTGTLRTPWSSMSSSTSDASRFGVTVSAGEVITSRIGVPRSSPAATTRVRRSASVTIPTPPSSSGMTTAGLPSTAARRAASCTGVSGGQISAGPRTSDPTGRCAVSGVRGPSSRRWSNASSRRTT